MPRSLKIPGALRSESDEPHLRNSSLFKPIVKHSLRIDAARAAEPEQVLRDVEDLDVLELDLDDGVRVWTRFDQFEEDVSHAGLESRDADGGLRFPSRYPTGSQERGWGGILIKGLKVLGIDVPGAVADFVADKIENRIEHGLYSWQEDGRFVRSEIESAQKEALVFLHGTASSTEGSFGDLLKEPQRSHWERTHELYAGRVFALEHRTLSVSPLQNAVDLLEELPADATLHLVSHSRGGLVGELLCHGRVVGLDRKHPFSRQMIANYTKGAQGGDRAAEVEALGRLNDLLAEKRPRVERFVRVACPAKGTTLASRRLDLYLSGIVNLLGLIPGFKTNPVFSMVSDLLIAVAKERTDPGQLPGLEAMMPTSPLIRLLNTSGLELEADLSVIAGDCGGGGLLARLKMLLDAFYLADHDIVVNTRSMDLGARRRTSPRRYFTRGPEVDHFSYFHNPDTVDRLFAGLERGETDQAGFQPLTPSREIPPSTPRGEQAEPRPVVFVLPGIMGSHLSVGKNRYWLDIPDLARGKFEKLQISAAGVTATAPIGLAYADLVKFLRKSHEVYPFPYDWRISIQQEADRLAESIQNQLDRTKNSEVPIQLLAHSMGGLVARVMISKHDKVWRAIKARGGRLIMLGTPNGGSYIIPRALLGREGIVKKIAFLDLKHKRAKLLEWISEFPGMLEMLPTPEEDLNFFQAQSWHKLKKADDAEWSIPADARLEAAWKTRELLDESAIDTDRMLYVAGVARRTPDAILVDAQDGVRFEATSRGDGRVPWKTGIPSGIKAWYVDAAHGKLADYRPAFEGILDLLEQGDTSRLSSTPPVARGIEERGMLPREDEAELFPDSVELAAAALGYDPRPLSDEPEEPLRVSVAHGDLASASSIVAVGHYKNDPIVSAEAALDRRLEYRLSARHQLGLYPGPIKTAEVLFSADRAQHPTYGGLIVGLGDVGELTPGRLSATVENGAVRYALAATEMKRAENPTAIPLSSLLIGNGEGGITVRSSVESIIRGVCMANRRLKENHQEANLRIGEIEFIELFEDHALEALWALESMDSKHFVIDPKLKRLEGGYRRVRYQEAQGWPTRLIIRTPEMSLPNIETDVEPAARRDRTREIIEFQTLGGRGRAGAHNVTVQRRLMDRLVDQAISRTAATSRDLPETLLELLVPPDLKAALADRRELVLVLDKPSARYPWEMLADRRDRENKPIGVVSGLVRQLKVPDPEPVAHPHNQVALVVGDPPSCLPVLKGAQHEARGVARCLEEQGWQVATQIHNKDTVSATSVIRTLMSEDYRVLHLAGHGVYDPGDAMRSGMVLDCEKGDNGKITKSVLLTPNEVRQMRMMPELVFINCCHLGREEGLPRNQNPARLASNLASQFIEMGVRVVVAAGWAVDDGAATTFAGEFYRRMLSGSTFGDAVSAAREATYDGHPSVNTWGAYQCYGDPGFRLRVGGARGSGQPWTFLDPVEAVADLNNLAEAAKTANTKAMQNGKLKLVNAVEEEVRKLGWIELANVSSALGAAYGASHDFAKAVGFLESAKKAQQASIAVEHLELLANIRTCLAKEQYGTSQITKGQAVEMINTSIGEIKELLKLGPTSERRSLLGGSYKRLAWLETGPARKEALVSMAGEYWQARKLSAYDYPALNALMGVILNGGPWQRPPKAFASNELSDSSRFEIELTRLERDAPLHYRENKTFWNAVMVPDCGVLRGLRQRSLVETEANIQKDYALAAKLGGSARQWASVLWQLEFIVEILESSRTRLRVVLPSIKRIFDAVAREPYGLE